MNIITLTGNSTKDVELRYSPNGKAISNGSIAVRRDFKNQHGEYETDFFNFVAVGKVGETMANYIKKGDKFGITGRLQNRVWEKDNGEKQYFTEVFVTGFDFPYKQREGQRDTNTSRNSSNANTGNYTKIEDDPFSSNGQSIDISDDDLPF